MNNSYLFYLLIIVFCIMLLCFRLYGCCYVRRVKKRSVEVKVVEEYEDGSTKYDSVEAIGSESLDVLGKLAKRKLLENIKDDR